MHDFSYVDIELFIFMHNNISKPFATIVTNSTDMGFRPLKLLPYFTHPTNDLPPWARSQDAHPF
jgi:hypothetical protein